MYDIPINNWLYCNKIQINISKTKYMFYSCKSVVDLESISIDIWQIILRSIYMKYSVIFINEHNMNFTQHINHICSNVFKSIGILIKIRYVFPSNIFHLSTRTFCMLLEHGLDAQIIAKIE